VVAAARALGVLRPDGRLDRDFFAHPLRELQKGLRLRARRREALDAIAALVPADPRLAGALLPGTEGARRTLHPLLPGLTQGQVSLSTTVRDEVAHLDVVVGLAGEYRAADGTRIAVELPLVRARDDALEPLAGTADGPLAVELAKPLGEDQSATARALVTAEGGRLAVGLHGVDLGAGRLPDLEVDTAQLGEDAVAAIVALLRALLSALEAGEDAALRALADHLPGALGLDSDLAALPLLALARDPHAFRAWLAAQVPAEGDVPALRSWVAHLLGLLGIDAALPAARPTPAAPWVVALAAGPPAVELTLALGARAGSGERALQAGLRLRAAGLALDATLVELPLGGEAPATPLPGATVVLAAPADGGGPLVDAPEVRVGALRAGLRWDGRRLDPLLELDDVRLPGAPPFERLDLSSADTLATTAVDVLDQAVRDALGESGLARPLRVLAGLDDALEERIDPVALATEPLAALRRFHVAALERPGGWRAQLAALAELLGAAAGPEAVDGAGTEADPWAVPLPALSSPDLSARLLAWDATPAGTTRGLRVGLAFTARAGDPHWALEWRGTLLAADLAPAGPARLRLLGAQRARARVDVPAADAPVRAAAVGLAASWEPGGPLSATATLDDVTIGEPPGVSLGDIALPGALDPGAPDLGLGAAAEQAWPALRTLLARAAADHGGAPGRALAALLGLVDDGLPDLPADWPPLPLPDAGDLRSILDDLAAVARARLARLAGDATGLGETGEPYVLAGLRLIRRLLAGELGSGTGPLTARAEEGEPAGTGAPADPWRLPLAGGDVRALAWLEPAGPPPAWARGAGAALDGDLDAALAAGARALPGVADALVGRGAAAAREAVDRLAQAIDGTDGLVGPDAARPAGAPWRSAADVTAAHQLLPRAAGAVSAVRDEIAARTAGLDPADWAVLLAGPSFVPAGLWDGLLAAVGGGDPAVADLASAPAPELADLGTLPAAAFYDVRLRDDGVADVAAQLTRVAERVRELRPGCRLLLVAHSTAGAPAARYAAAHPEAVLGLVALGSPLAAVPAGPLADPAVAEAVRTVRALAPLLGVPELDDVLGFVAEAADGLGSDGSPRAVPASSFTDVPELPDLGELPALAIAGTLPAGLAGALERALAGALQALPDDQATPAPTHFAAGVEAALPLPAAAGGEVRVELDGAAELGAVRLDAGGPGVARAPRLRVRARIVRDGGALLDRRLSEAGVEVAARVRWAELAVAAGGGEPAAFSVRLHETSLRGVRRAVADLEDADGRQLLALLVEELDRLAAGTPRLRALLDLLEADLGLLLKDARGRLAVAADAIAALRSDPGAWLSARLPDLLDGEDGLLGLVRDPLAAAGRGPWRRSLPSLPLEIELRRHPWAVAVRTTGDGLALGSDAWLAGAALMPMGGGEPSAEGRLALGDMTIARDAQRTTVAVEGVLGAVAVDDVAEMRAALARLAEAAALGAVIADLVPARVRAHVPDIAALLRDPGGLLHARLQAAGDPARVRGLLADAAGAIGLAVRDDGAVELPGGLAVTATGTGDGRLRLGLATPADGLAIEGAATLALDAAVAVDGGRGAAPSAEVALTADVPGGWGTVTLQAALTADGVRIAVRPATADELVLVPRFSGWEGVVGAAAERLLGEALDALAGAVPAGPIRSAALGVAHALDVFDTSFADGALALRELTIDTIRERAQAAAQAVTALLERSLADVLPAGATLTADGAAARLEVPGILGGPLSLGAELDGPAVALALAGAAGPARLDVALRWADAPAGNVDLELDLGRALGFTLRPVLAVRLGELSVALLPLGAGTGDRARIELAPAPGVTLTAAGRAEVGRTWLAPPALRVLLDAAGDRLDRSVYAGGPTARALLRAAGVLDDGDGLRVPLPAPLAMLGGLAPELAGAAELPLGIADAVLALDGAAGERVGVVLSGDVARTVGGLEVRLLSGEGLALELLSREDGGWALRPRLRLQGVGAGLARAGGQRLVDTRLFRLGGLDARAGTVLDLAPGDGRFAPGPWSTELELRELGLPALTATAGENPVAGSLLQAAERDEGDA
jgi:hypothetical protein